METEKSEKDLIVDVGSKEVQIALMENHRLIELNKESSQGHTFSIGDVFLGRVKKVMPALNAAFVDIGDSKEAFIHYLDLGLFFNSFDEFVKKFAYLKKFGFITDSDAHFINNVGDVYNVIYMEHRSFAEFAKALRNEDGRYIDTMAFRNKA